MKNYNFFEDIHNASQKSTLTFFVGAGVSRISGYPGWGDLINEFCNKLGISKFHYCSEEYLSIPQKYYANLDIKDKNMYNAIIKSQLNKKDVKHNEIHNLMLQLRPASFVTTNYDMLIEEAAISNGFRYSVIAKDKDLPKIDGSKYILKIHGDFKNNNIVLKEDDYLNYSDNFKLIEIFMKSIFAVNTIVFIGYSLNDYNVKSMLNFVKQILGKEFKKPYFIYTDDEEMDTKELNYQKERGLKIIDWHNYYDVIDNTDDKRFKFRYSAIMKSILNTNIDYSIMSKEERFDVLYNKLSPLDILQALRNQDIQNALNGFCSISNGIIEVDNFYIFELYIEIYEISRIDNNIPSEHIDKYNCITSVLRKAWITQYNYRSLSIYKEPIVFSFNYTFASSMIWSLDYITMEKLANKKYNNLLYEYEKAYFLVKICQYDKAYTAYKEIAIEAYKYKNYVLFYLAQKNRVMTFKIIEYSNNHPFSGVYNTYSDLIESEKEYINLISKDDYDNIFLQLPFDEKCNYSFLNGFYNYASLNKLLAQTFDLINEQKKHISNNTKTMGGFTPSGKINNALNESLHFVFENYIPVELFSEFSTTIKEQIKAMIYQISIQDKPQNSENSLQGFDIFSQPHFKLNEKDFYCLITFFDSKEIIGVMRDCNISELPFDEINSINTIINNIITYYNVIIHMENPNILMFKRLEQTINNILSLCRYIKLPIKTSEMIIMLFAKNPATIQRGTIDVSDVRFFLDAQVFKFSSTSQKLRKSILELILFYQNKFIESFEKGESPKFYHKPGDGLPALANYLVSSNKKPISFVSLSDLIEKLLPYISELGTRFFHDFYSNVSKPVREKIETAILEKIEINADLSDLIFLLSVHKNKTKPNTISKLVDCLKNELNTSDYSQNAGVVIYHPRVISTEDYFCFFAECCAWGWIKEELLSELKGKVDIFDFIIDPIGFDETKIKAEWFKRLNKPTIEYLCKIPNMKNTLITILSAALKNGILTQYDFCMIISKFMAMEEAIPKDV